MRAATQTEESRTVIGLNFNPRSPCGLRPIADYFGIPTGVISIHAAHAGCDVSPVLSLHRVSVYFNPRSPCGLRHFEKLFEDDFPEFQSTQPMRAATPGVKSAPGFGIFQSTQPMRAATPTKEQLDAKNIISIHAAHAGCDYKMHVDENGVRISIHAAHAGCDLSARFK